MLDDGIFDLRIFRQDFLSQLAQLRGVSLPVSQIEKVLVKRSVHSRAK
jgi:hypothetical protein